MIGAPDPTADRESMPSGPHQTATAETVLDSRRPDVPAAVRPESRRSRLPAAALFSSLGLFSVIAIVSTAVALRPTSAIVALEEGASASSSNEEPTSASGEEKAPEEEPPPAPPPRTTATPEELIAAQAEGVPALAALVSKYPTDAEALRVLALAQGRDRNSLVEAVASVKRLLEIAPTQSANTELRPLLLRAANATPDLAAAAFDVLARRMGSHGPDLLYEITINPGMGKHPVERAGTLLAEEAVRKLASPALLVADDLRRLKKCPTKPLLERARQHGDARALHYLNPIKRPVKCGFLSLKRCTQCPSVYAEAVAAIQEIEQRREPQ
ncbi:hypothetical protein [Chondromyces crocatus]|uniref:Uncharacterized protein n=1 Tax=Chondromyces crocatus TaxID=52 RepID=A0A0K1ELL3_CHOCO|nr:hypothetical protein [Chondromyces crocatus]AKT41701.1 uncharacterized protein CMC5_059100 [Chondromyces crocatus]